MSEQHSVIQLSEISLSYGTKTLFSQMNVSFAAKGISFLVGANGVGKSQLLRLIHGLVVADSGTVSAPPVIEQVLLTQAPILLARSVWENIVFIRGREVCSTARFDELSDSVIQAFGLQDILCQQAMTLSGGQQKRVALARTFLHDAQCYLIDEPSANIDYHSTRCIESALEELANSGKKVIVTSHDMPHIERLFTSGRDELVVLSQGVVALQEYEYNFEHIKDFM